MATTAPVPRISAARQRILDAASRVFYARGVHTVPVDEIIAEATVTRATFYRHFPGKKDLVVAYLQAQDEHIRSAVGVAETEIGDPGETLRALFGYVMTQVCGQAFRGCPFINAAAEHPDSAAPVRQVISTHRDWFRTTLQRLAASAGHPSPAEAADVLVILRDGTMVAGYLGDPVSAGHRLAAQVEAILGECRPG